MSKLVSVEPIETSETPATAHNDARALVFWLHGLGDTPYGWHSGCQEIQRHVPHVKFLLPQAPTAPVSCNGGAKSTSWHDLRAIPVKPMGAGESYAGRDDNVAALDAMIQAEIDAGTPSERIVIGGFSQGAAMSAVVGYRQANKLGGVVCLSGYLPYSEEKEFVGLVSEAGNTNTPALICHGKSDQVVAYSAGQHLQDVLKQKCGAPARLASYRGLGHGADPSELADVGKFLADVLPAE